MQASDGLQEVLTPVHQVVNGVRHVSRAVEPVPELAVFTGDYLLFDAEGRPTAVVRVLDRPFSDAYRLRYGTHVRKAAADQAGEGNAG